MKLLFSLIPFLFLSIQSTQAITYTTISSGDWENISTWDGNGIPPNPLPSGDLIEIQAGNTVTINSAITLSLNAHIFNYGSIINQNTIILNPNSSIVGLTNSSFINNGDITMFDNTFIYSEGTGVFTNNGTMTLNGPDTYLAFYGTSTFTNNFIITVDDNNNSISSYIGAYDSSVYINNGDILLVNGAQIYTQDNAIFYTCNPAPVYDGITIFNGGGSVAPVPQGNPCDDGDLNTHNDIWDGDCNCVQQAPIPTLSQWSIMALGIISLIFGVVRIRQRGTILA